MTREDNAIDAGEKYKIALFQNKEGFEKDGLVAEINRVDQNENISKSNKAIELSNYENIKRVYDSAQVDSARKTLEQITKDVEQNTNDVINKTSCPGQIWDKTQQKCVDLPKAPGFESLFSIVIFIGLYAIGRLPRKKRL